MAGKTSHTFRPDIRVRLIGTRPFFGPGTSTLLRAIQECGSVLGACERLERSYSKGRAILRSAEQELGLPLVHRTKGGVGGGSASLTEAGVRRLDGFERYQADVRRYAQEHFDALRAQLEHPECENPI